jgi:cell division protein FtsL
MIKRFIDSAYFLPIAGLIVVGLLLGLFKTKSEAAATRKRIAVLEQSIAEGRAQEKALAAEVQFLESPARVEALARRELRMAPPAPARPIDGATQP